MEKMEKIKDKINETGARVMFKATNLMGKALQKRWGKVVLLVPLMLSLIAIPAYAEATGGTTGGASADSFINEVVSLLKTWIPRLGGMVVVVGGIQFGLGFKDDNPDQKTRGMQCMIGGAIVAAIGGLVSF